MVQSGKKQTPNRVKHVPQRTCIACRRTDAKRGLIRLVRTPEGSVVADPSGKSHGRGAYLCHSVTCWEQALKRQILQRALRTEPLSADNQHNLLLYIQGLAVSAAAPLQPDAADDDAPPHDVI
ncbi:RNase P modulator RnpM [Candidatus Oscillochloris fontis]|uniref:RNase P modulator RnpM n=1 Tax=Candidatus Oscillochloris fontis TaxID=2496868 RepID=UPI00101DE06C|nr:YlxR family protein [Candidatus Oscillochloris fontis]